MAPAVARTETVVPIVIAPESSGVTSLSVGVAGGVGSLPVVGVGGVTVVGSVTDADIDMDIDTE